MTENRGVAPPDMTTEVGKFRALIGDVEYTEYDPVQPGFGMYEKLSDLEIEGFLAVADGSPDGAMYYAYMQLAGDAALSAKAVQDFDLRISTEKRATELRLIAQMWKDRWDASTEDFFEVFDVVEAGGCTPELAAHAFCWGKCNGRQFF